MGPPLNTVLLDDSYFVACAEFMMSEYAVPFFFKLCICFKKYRCADNLHEFQLTAV